MIRIIILYILFSLISCDNSSTSTENDPGLLIKTGKVTFINYTSYDVVVHKDYFNGVVLLELSAGQTKSTDVRTSDNYGIGSVFSIEYLYKINDGFDTESGNIIASGIDPNVQINRVIEEGRNYTIQIPQPANLEFKTAFLKILNSYNLPFELRYLGTSFMQTGNGNLSVPPGKTGVYKIESIPNNGKLMENYRVVTNFNSTTIPDFTVRNGFVYSFTYNGTAVSKTGEQTIIFK